jgi:hypothetical protein
MHLQFADSAMDDLLATPVARAGPTSRLLRRQSTQGPPGGRRPGSLASPAHRLDTSLRLLDSALGSPIPAAEHYVTEDVTRLVEVTRPLDSSHRLGSRADFTLGADVTSAPLVAEQTMALGEENPGVRATENLFEDFLSTLSGGDSGASALDSIAELEQMVGGAIIEAV